MASNNPYFNNFIPAGNQQAAGTQAYGASAGPSPGYSAGGHSAPAAGQTSYDTAYPNTAAFAGYYGFPGKPNYEPSKNYFPGPTGPGKQDGQGLPSTHYQGYEAAFFNAAHAYLHHQPGPKPPQMGGGGQMSGNKAGHGGGGQGGPKTRGRYFAGGFNQRWTSSSTQQLHYCEVCKISCASPQTYKDHLDGQKHKKKEAAVRTGLPMVPTPRTGAALHCELCNVTCTSSDAYAAHIRGTKHQKVVKLHTKLGKPIPPAEPQLIHSKTPGATGTTTTTPATTAGAVTTTPTAVTTSTAITAAPTPAVSVLLPTAPTAAVVKIVAATPKINFLGGNYLNTLAGSKTNGSESEAALVATAPASQIIKKEDVPMTAAAATETAQAVVAQWEEEKVIQPVGQDYVEELRGGDGKITGFNCRLCDCRFNDVNAKDMHLKGRRHRLMYKKKVDPNLVVEAKGWPALRQKNKTLPGWQERRKPNEGGWEGAENYEEMPQAPSAMEDGNQPRPPAYWASPSRGGLRHGGISLGLPPPPQYFPTGSMPMGLPNPAMRKPESNDDRHVMAKHAEIYPSEAELEAIQTLVSYVERSLKLVSDQLTHQPEEKTKISETQSSDAFAQSPVPAATAPAVAPTTDASQSVVSAPVLLAATVTTPTTTSVAAVVPAAVTTAVASSGMAQPQRMLKGVMRVGLLAKGLLLKGDRSVQLVVLCSQPPTYLLLDRVAHALPVHLSVVAPSITFTVETLPNEAVVMVKSVQGHGLAGDILVKVSLTSPVVREEQLAAAATVAINGTASMGNDVDMNDIATVKEGRLNTKDCLHSLALLRRAKWFQARANTLQNCVLVIRVMRDFCLRSPVWSNLELWPIELIVERAAFSAGTPLSSGDVLRRVFETLSAGILLSNNDGWGPGIGDPCEKDAIDVCSNLTAQEREDMTASAQQSLRQIAFRQIFKVLGMPKPLSSGSRSFNKASPATAGPSPGKKRPRENSTSDAISPEGEVPTDLKKEKIEGQEA